MRPLIAGVLAVLLTTAGAVPVRTADAPRLLVVLVVDQLRADYLTTFARRWQRGFKQITERGARFVDAAYPYWSTVTCAGHSTIGTGTLPRTHGMVLNRWWDREARRVVACTDDGDVRAVSYGRPATAGHSPRRRLAPTIGDAVQEQRPGGRVVSLSLKPRSAVGLGGHSGSVVVWMDDAAGAFVTSSAFAPQPVPAVQAFIDRNPISADENKVWHPAGDEREYLYPDTAVGERPGVGWTAMFPHRLAAATPHNPAFIEQWQKSPFADAYLGRMAASLVDELRLGQRDTTDFLGVSFSALDIVGHEFGPRSREVEALLVALDGTIGSLVDHLDRAVGRDRYLLALTSDHGVAAIPEQIGAGRVANEDVAAVVEQALISAWGAPAGRYVESAAGGQVYFAAGVFDRLRQSDTVMRAVEDALRAVPGVARVVRADRLTASNDDVVASIARGYVANRSGDLFVIPQPDWILAPRADDAATTHGTHYEYDRRVPLIIAGPGITPGDQRSAASPADIAPTLAHLAGITLPRAEGRVLREALR